METRLERKKRQKVKAAGNVAAAYLALLADRGVDYLFGNAGTDFAPLIEAYAQAARTGAAVPRPILATHENLAVAMAHGYGMVSRRIPAVMAHVSVGTANMICAALNAARENVAILLTAGRSPITETGLPGSRDGYIHWAQEMYDQAGMIREIVKWDYELRNAEQLTTVVDRALAIAATEPRGPVYLSLPREVIAAPVSDFEPPSPSRLSAAAPPAPDADAIAAAARTLAQATWPLIVTTNAGRDAAAFKALTQFTERFAIPVVQHRPRYLSLPSSHPMHLGFDPARLVQNADAILVLESDVPWIPSRAAPRPDCKIIQCGLDPLFARYPIRGFPCDVAITEYTLFLDHCAFEFPDLYFGSSSASGLGWGAGAALGAKLARAQSPVMAVLGDGAYMFCNPAAVHHASALHDLPVLFVVMNNGMWGAVERSTLAMYAGGRASRSNRPAFVHLDRLPAFERICEAAGGYGERVEDPAALPAALERAMLVTKNERRQALLN